STHARSRPTGTDQIGSTTTRNAPTPADCIHMAKKKPPPGTLPTPTDDHDRKLLADVKEYGWHVIAVLEDEEGPAFAYSIGLFHTFDHPEVIVFGLDVRLMQQIVNGIGVQIKSGERFEHLDEAGDVLEGYNVLFRRVEKEHY